MASIISRPINHPVHFLTPKGEVSLSHPTIDEVPIIIRILQDDGLDVRRMTKTASDAFSSIGKRRVDKEWGKALDDFRNIYPNDKTVFEDIRI